MMGGGLRTSGQAALCVAGLAFVVSLVAVYQICCWINPKTWDKYLKHRDDES
jgi:hypothetical protein